MWGEGRKERGGVGNWGEEGRREVGRGGEGRMEGGGEGRMEVGRGKEGER